MNGKLFFKALDVAGIRYKLTGKKGDFQIDRLTADSREAAPNSVFVAVRGSAVDGHLFIDKAVNNGAIVVVCETIPEAVNTASGVVYVKVADTRKAWAALNAAFYGYPSSKLKMVGVTGTNGKTTTTFLLHHVLTQLGEKTGLIGTVEYRIGSTVRPSAYTTPDAGQLNRLLGDMVDAGCDACVMEVSSHALHQMRVFGQHFSAGVFTNLTRDHLDYHNSIEEYLRAKKMLFDGLESGAVAVINADDPACEQITEDTHARKISFGRSVEADIQYSIKENTIKGLILHLDGSECAFKLVGAFNAENLATAYATAVGLGFAADDVKRALESAPAVPGRFEQISFDNGVTAVVDYAHTPDALENVLQTLVDLNKPGSSIWCVFGCGGDRDPGKRPQMGTIAEKYAHKLVVTSDNPRTEDPLRILDDIRTGITYPDEVMWQPDRRLAIRFAVGQAKPGDMVLIAGKGHEPYQVLGTEKIHFDDREEVKAAYAELHVRSI